MLNPEAIFARIHKLEQEVEELKKGQKDINNRIKSTVGEVDALRKLVEAIDDDHKTP